jgi:uncharacterized membrane protein YgaE (UPF0421/DUF939 family)
VKGECSLAKASFRSALQLGTRSAVGATLAFAIAQGLNLDFPIFALVGAVIATDLTPAQSRELGLRRVVATFVGALTGVIATSAKLTGLWAVAPSIVVAVLISYRVGAYEGARVAGYICGLIVLLDESAQPWHYAFFRLVETVLGVLVAWGLSFVPKLLRPDQDDVEGSEDGTSR